MPLLLPPVPALHQTAIAVAPQAPLLGDAERGLFAALDAGEDPIRPAKLLPEDRPVFNWLWAAAAWKPGAKAPSSPFFKGSAGDREAQVWRAFLAGGSGDPAEMPLHQSGSRLLLWTWMRNRDRHAPLPKAERRTLEDRLLDGGPAILQGWALRHALCFAVAERDAARLGALKASHGAKAPDTFSGTQALLGLLDGPGPVFRLWQLPGLGYQDTRLGGLGARKVWICPPGFPVPEGAAWVIPSATGNQDGREADLIAGMKAEAQVLLPELKGRAAWFAASRTEWEEAGLSWFPILIELDANGNVISVRMGDAAP